MQLITKWIPKPITWLPPGLDLRQLPARLTHYLGLTPLEFLTAINALALAQWAVKASHWWLPLCLPGSRRGPKQVYSDASILLLALVQTAWQMPYHIVIQYLKKQHELAVARVSRAMPRVLPASSAKGITGSVIRTWVWCLCSFS